MAARTATRKRRSTRPPWVRRVKQFVALTCILCLGAVVAVAGYFAFLVQDAQQQMGTLETRMEDVTKAPTEMVSSDGQLLYRVQSENRIPVRLSEVPEVVKNAVLAAEDKRFYQHTGYDLMGLGRAVFLAAREGKVAGGGSTLTMQLSKRLYTGTEQTLVRKLQDIALAATIEKRLSKDQILELYLNQVYFGERAYGIGAASQVYFRKKVGDLTLAEAAMLARCVRRPSVDNPIHDYARAMRNKATVLTIMREERMIDDSEFRKALEDEPRVNPTPPKTTAAIRAAPYFVEHVLAVLKKELPEIDVKRGGYRIETTLDTKLQKQSEEAVRSVVQRYRRQGVTTGAFVLIDAEGRILAEVGGVDYEKEQFNVVAQGIRQPGSSFKPFVYSAALASGALGYGESVSNAAERYWDAGSRKWYAPKNLGGSRLGSSISLETALKYSVNRAAVNTLAKTGIQTVVGYCRDTFGFPAARFANVGDSSYSLALGTAEVAPLEMAEAYSVFMLGGDRVRPRTLVRVVGPDGQVIKRWDTVKFRHVLDSSAASQVDDALREVVEGGSGSLARSVPGSRGKTGTTQEGKDAWFCGYTDGLVGIAWVANVRHENGRPVYRPMPSVFGGKVPIQIWTAVMKEAYGRFASKQVKAPVEVGPPIETVPEEPVEVPAPDVTEPTDLGPLPDNPTDEASPGLQPGGEGSPPVEEPPVVNPPADPPRPVETRSPPRRDPDLVEVEVCADTGMRASLYCPETVPRTYPRNRAPRSICSRHRSGG